MQICGLKNLSSRTQEPQRLIKKNANATVSVTGIALPAKNQPTDRMQNQVGMYQQRSVSPTSTLNFFINNMRYIVKIVALTLNLV